MQTVPALNQAEELVENLQENIGSVATDQENSSICAT